MTEKKYHPPFLNVANQTQKCRFFCVFVLLHLKFNLSVLLFPRLLALNHREILREERKKIKK